MPAAVVGELDLRLLRLVDLPVRDVPAVRRPVPRLREAELLLVHPVEVAVEHVLRRVGRQPPLLLRREIDDVHVAVALVAEHRAVRRELGGARAFAAELQRAAIASE